MSDPLPRLLILAGPSSAGKTAAALWVAEKWSATVLSADAMQVYRGMDIGTGKVTPSERAQVPHEGVDVRQPDEHFDASDFVTLGDGLLSGARRIVAAGGTSLYLRALVRGLVGTPPVDTALRAELERIPDLHAALAEVDPALATRLHPNDRVRLVRGLEVYRQTGQPLSTLQAEHAARPDRVDAVGLWLDREDLRPRIDARVLQMLEDGYVQEVRGLLDAGYGADLRPMQSLGYRHLCAHLLDDLALDEAVRRTQRDTWSFARKQRNWMRVLGYPRVGSSADHLAAVGAAAEQLWGPS